jgi:hypothetical protein
VTQINKSNNLVLFLIWDIHSPDSTGEIGMDHPAIGVMPLVQAPTSSNSLFLDYLNGHLLSLLTFPKYISSKA